MSLLLTQLGGAVPITGTGASIQAAQTSTAAGAITVSGSAAGTQGAQTSTASGGITVTGSGAGTQGAQTSTASGTITVSGSSANTETAQVSVAAGEVIEGITGTSANVQAAQTSSASGSIQVATAGGVKKVKASRVNWIPWHGQQSWPSVEGTSRNFARAASSKASGLSGHIGSGNSKAMPARTNALGYVGYEADELAMVLVVTE